MSRDKTRWLAELSFTQLRLFNSIILIYNLLPVYRMHLKKIRQLVFYSLPTYPQFFSEICNMYKTSQLTDASCLVLFSNSEAHKLSMCIGHERTKHILTSTKKNLFMFVTGEE